VDRSTGNSRGAGPKRQWAFRQIWMTLRTAEMSQTGRPPLAFVLVGRSHQSEEVAQGRASPRNRHRPFGL
jgi:hypothetical protein